MLSTARRHGHVRCALTHAELSTPAPAARTPPKTSSAVRVLVSADPGSRTTDPALRTRMQPCLADGDPRLARALVPCPIGGIESDDDRSGTTTATPNAEAEREPEIPRLREFRAELLNRHGRGNRDRRHVRARDVSELHAELCDDHTGRSA